MASLYKKPRSPYWYIQELNAKGKWSHRSLKLRHGHSRDTREARSIEATITARERQTAGFDSRLNMDQWVPNWIKTHFQEELTRTRVTNCWTALSTFFADRKIQYASQVTRAHCFEFMEWRKETRHHNTALLEIKYLSQILSEARLRRQITENPALKLGIKRIPGKEKSALTDDQIERLLNELDRIALVNPERDWMPISFRIALFQGVRLQETCVPIKDISFETNVMHFGKPKGGANKSFSAMIHPALRPLLESIAAAGKSHTCLLPKYAAKLFHQVFRRLGIDASFHCTRVTVITRLAIHGVDQRLAMLYVNHSSEAVHKIYTKLRPEHAAPVAAALQYPSPGLDRSPSPTEHPKS